MNNVTLTLENRLIDFATQLYAMNSEVADISQYYFGSTAQTLVTGLATDSTPATTGASGGYTKAQFINGITLCQTLQNFFGNQAVAQGGYQGICDTLRDSSANASTPLSNDVEAIGARIKALAQTLIQLNKDAANTEKLYTACGLSGIIGGIPQSNIVFGCNISQSNMLSGIVLVQQFQALMGNAAVTQGDYLSTITSLVMGA